MLPLCSVLVGQTSFGFLLLRTGFFFRVLKKDALKKDSSRLCSFAVLIICVTDYDLKLMYIVESNDTLQG